MGSHDSGTARAGAVSQASQGTSASQGSPGAVEKKQRLLDVYNSYFDSVPVETDEERQLAFRLRYEVYCIEHPFEDPSQNPDGIETDPFDEFALHSLLVHRPSKTVVGTVRLILPRLDDPNVDLPIRNVCRHELLCHDNPRLPRAKTAEISRFAVSKTYRRRTGDDQTTVGGYFSDDSDPRRLIPNISLGLMQSIVAMAAKSRVSHLCAVMEPTLLRLLARLGIHFHNLGPRVQYHGTRQPCFSDLDELLARAWVERREVWELLTRDGALWPINPRLASAFQSGGMKRSH
jgi:N-acyl amino acid synthase of PEP-CTERM/exosortase system